LWNLLPANKKVNQNQKKAKIPTPKLLEKCKYNIFEYWSYYNNEDNIFKNQIQISLNGDILVTSTDELFDKNLRILFYIISLGSISLVCGL